MEDTGKMKQIGRGFFLILALVCVLGTANAGEYHHDGDWWRTLTYADKLAYMTGFIDGAVCVAVDKKIGNPFSSNDLPVQWVRDLDSFYEKPQNRRFLIPLIFADIDKLKGGRR
jgi:hypothetical protein